MGNSIGARKCSSFKAVSTAPSMNKTPVGNSTPPLPYPTVADLSNSVATVESVRFNGNPAYVLNQTTQPSCKGDDPGVCKGVKSGTVNGEVKPVKGSTTVRAGRKPVIRQGDPCTMNGGNNPGIYVTTQTPSCSIEDGAPDEDTDPPIEPETPEEESWLSQWWENTKHEVGEAVEHPWEATKGALKGIANIPSDLGEMVMKGGALQGAADMEQAAAMQSLFGQTQSAEKLAQAAQGVRASTDAISLPKFQMANPAQAGGDKIVTGASLLAGGAGLVKSGVRGVGALGKTAASVEGQAVKGVAETGKVLQGEKALAEGTKAADATADVGKAAGAVEVGTAKPAGDGVKVVAQPKPKTPNKPRKPRTYEKKVINEDGSITYTLKDKEGRLFDVTYKDGYPDFSNYKYKGSLGKNEVQIEMTGKNTTDFARANKAAGFGDKPYSHPEGYIWHHHQDGKTMQLIEAAPHATAPHTGGASLARGAIQ